MPRKGHAYAISPTWQRQVLERLKEMGISQNELARRAKISKAAMSGALKSGAIQTTVMGAINKVLGMGEPQPTAFTKDSIEMLDLYSQLTERDQGALVENLRNKVAMARANATKRHGKN